MAGSLVDFNFWNCYPKLKLSHQLISLRCLKELSDCTFKMLTYSRCFVAMRQKIFVPIWWIANIGILPLKRFYAKKNNSWQGFPFPALERYCLDSVESKVQLWSISDTGHFVLVKVALEIPKPHILSVPFLSLLEEVGSTKHCPWRDLKPSPLDSYTPTQANALQLTLPPLSLLN